MNDKLKEALDHIDHIERLKQEMNDVDELLISTLDDFDTFHLTKLMDACGKTLKKRKKDEAPNR